MSQKDYWVEQKYVLDETIYEGLNMNRYSSSDEQNGIVEKKLN